MGREEKNNNNTSIGKYWSESINVLALRREQKRVLYPIVFHVLPGIEHVVDEEIFDPYARQLAAN